MRSVSASSIAAMSACAPSRATYVCANTSAYRAVSTAVTCAPRRLNSCATRVVPVNRSSARRAPASPQMAPNTGTSRRFDPKYLIRRDDRSLGGVAKVVSQSDGRHVLVQIELAGIDPDADVRLEVRDHVL